MKSLRTFIGYSMVVCCCMTLLGCAASLLTAPQVELKRKAKASEPSIEIFQVGDRFAHAWVEMNDVEGQHTLRWRWIDPNKQVYVESDPLTFGHTGKRYAQHRATHKIKIVGERAAELPGQWMVQVFLDDFQKPMAHQVFRINPVIRRSKRRTALVIGNGAYLVGALANPLHDAEDLATTLRDLDFQVMLLKDASQNAMQRAIETFTDQLGKDGIGLFYYAGHGIQVDGVNYLIPIDSRLDQKVDVRSRSVSTGWLFDRMEKAKNNSNIVILDACRDNPFARSWSRGTSRGLAITEAPRGLLIEYATAPGRTAADGEGRNSPYTRNLLRYITMPDVEVELMFKEVRTAVVRETQGQQIPWESSSLIGKLYLAGESRQR